MSHGTPGSTRRRSGFGRPRWSRLVVLVATALCTLTSCGTTGGTAATGHTETDHEAARKRAVELYYTQHDLAQAIPVLEWLIGENPQDLEVVELLSSSLFCYSPALEEGSAERRQAILRSRELAQRGKEMGSTFLMMDLILASTTSDGQSDVSFSQDKAVEEAMKKG